MAITSWKRGDYFRSSVGYGVVIDDKGTAVLVKGHIGKSVVKEKVPEDALEADPTFLVETTRVALIAALTATSNS